MKKFLSLLLVLIMSFALLASCGENETPDEPIKVSVLNGTTGFGMAHLMEQNATDASSNKYEFTVETDAKNIISALMAGTVDMAALPTNAAANVYNKTNGAVQVLAINTLGVLYLAQKDGKISSINELSGKTIYVPEQNPTFITKYIFESKGVDVTIDSTTFATPAALQAAVVAGQVEFAVLPQPVITAAIAGAKKASFTYNIALDLTAEWNSIEGAEQLVQGCIVVRREFAEKNKEAVDSFLTEYEASINYLNANYADVSQLIVKYGIFANATVAENALPKCNIKFMKGEEMKTAMGSFIEAMYGIAPESIGNMVPSADFYYIQ